MGIVDKFSFLRIQKILTIFFSIILSACLPVQKKTQCGDNEAFDGSERRCVPVVGAATTGSVFIISRSPSISYTADPGSSAVTHQVAVSDAYEFGFRINWYVHATTTVTTTSTVAPLIHQAPGLRFSVMAERQLSRPAVAIPISLPSQPMTLR